MFLKESKSTNHKERSDGWWQISKKIRILRTSMRQMVLTRKIVLKHQEHKKTSKGSKGYVIETTRKQGEIRTS